MSIKDVINFVKKYVTKTTVIVALVILSSGLIYATYNLRTRLISTRFELASTEVVLDIVAKEKARLDSLATVYAKSIKDRDNVIVEKDKKIKLQERKIKTLEDSLKQDLDDVTLVTAYSSYAYINNRVKPIDVQKYPFDSVQVKKIHYTFVERDGLFNIKFGLDSLVTDLRLLSSIKDNQIVELKSLNNVYINQKSICIKENEAYKIQIEGLNKTVKRERFMKKLTTGTALGLTGYIIVNAILN